MARDMSGHSGNANEIGVVGVGGGSVMKDRKKDIQQNLLRTDYACCCDFLQNSVASAQWDFKILISTPANTTSLFITHMSKYPVI